MPSLAEMTLPQDRAVARRGGEEGLGIELEYKDEAAGACASGLIEQDNRLKGSVANDEGTMRPSNTSALNCRCRHECRVLHFRRSKRLLIVRTFFFAWAKGSRAGEQILFRHSRSKRKSQQVAYLP